MALYGNDAHLEEALSYGSSKFWLYNKKQEEAQGEHRFWGETLKQVPEPPNDEGGKTKPPSTNGEILDMTPDEFFGIPLNAYISREILKRIKELIGKSDFNIQSVCQKQYQEIAEVVRKVRPKAVVVGGGPYTSASYEDILNRQIVDIAVIEEGEVTFVELISRLREDAVIPTDVHGTAVLVEGAVRMNPKRMLVADIDSLPFPDYEQVDLDSYSGFSNHAFQSANECAFIYSSRGCPYRCYYCHEALVKTVRRRSPENVVLELEEHYHRRGIKNFVFADDIFNVPKKIGKEILHQVIDRLPGVSLNFPNGLRADQLDDEFLDLLEKAGTVHMALAVETASPRLQKVVGKNLKIEKT